MINIELGDRRPPYSIYVIVIEYLCGHWLFEGGTLKVSREKRRTNERMHIAEEGGGEKKRGYEM
ncbi:hypothetical protein K435DRAFT_112112 [Dendrothele bispora CBS 962.96]|uniref:Uncharacterized protein n=1 Tax=Dendrothele bispora (strain CBS 962.96) TaxID=1314807 RepID=A0A4S8M2I5_DENBC|nr:hypothetical protein K435DRAFT_112112 [Dendrothele bispora CBS 962.96]